MKKIFLILIVLFGNMFSTTNTFAGPSPTTISNIIRVTYAKLNSVKSQNDIYKTNKYDVSQLEPYVQDNGYIDVGNLIEKDPYIQENTAFYGIEEQNEALKEIAPNGKIRYKLSEKYFTIYYPTGEVLTRVRLKDGILDNVYTTYYRSGNIKEIREFSNDGKDLLLKLFYTNGKISNEVRFKNYKLNGIEKDFYESGNLRAIGSYLDGKPHGTAKIYYEDGILQEESTYKDGYLDGPFKSYYPNGNLMEEGMYKNGVPHGLIRTYYENGQIANESNVINGQFSGLVKSYYPSGQLKHKSFSKNHQPDGEDIFYYENGQIAIKGIYSEGVPLSFTAFDKNGNELTSKKEITRLLLYFVSLEKVQ